jgi:amidophosphoribosyltransferase
VEEVKNQIGADSLGFLGLDTLEELAPDAQCGFCKGCFTDKYPIDVEKVRR